VDRGAEQHRLKANASKRKAMSYGRMCAEERRLRDEIAALTTQAEWTDVAEDVEHGADVRDDELPAEVQRRETRLATIAAAKARLEARQAVADREQGRTPEAGLQGLGRKPFTRDFGVPPDTAQENFTDPESRIMNTTAGFDQCYNAQTAVDEVSQLIVATGLSNGAADQGALLPLGDRVQDTLGTRPTGVLADAGYRDDATLVALETRAITAYVSLGREAKATPVLDPTHEATRLTASWLRSTSLAANSSSSLRDTRCRRCWRRRSPRRSFGTSTRISIARRSAAPRLW
jgi:hypothetical protein